MYRPHLAAHPPCLRPNIFQQGTTMMNLREFFFKRTAKDGHFFRTLEHK
jgi:hypothetical protein